jgi:hypothetical protein
MLWRLWPRSYSLDFMSWRRPRLRSSSPRLDFRRDLGWSPAIAPTPTKSIRSTGLHPVRWKGSHDELPRLHPERLHSEQSRLCQKHGRPAATPAPAPNKLDPSVQVLPSLWSTLTAGAIFDYILRVVALGVVLFSALRKAIPR